MTTTTQPGATQLPAGAATAALQPALNVDSGALSHVVNFPATQPVSAASLPLPAGAATAALQPALNGDGGAAPAARAAPGRQGDRSDRLFDGISDDGSHRDILPADHGCALGFANRRAYRDIYPSGDDHAGLRRVRDEQRNAC